MTISESAAASGCLTFRKLRRRIAMQGATLSTLMLLAAACSAPARAESYIKLGVARFAGPDQFDGTSRGFDLSGGWQLREHLAIEAGLIDQEGDIKLSQADPAFFSDTLLDYRWRALHVGPRFSMALGSRWLASAGLALAHVALEREQYTAVFSQNQVIGVRRSGTFRDQTLGVLATLGVAFDLSPQQRLSLDYRRLEAGLSQRCEGSEYIRCDFTAHETTDGLALSWSVRFR